MYKKYHSDKLNAKKRTDDICFGIRAVTEAVRAGKEIDKILIKKNIESDIVNELFEELKNRDIPVQRVPIERLNRITMKNHQGVIAYVSAVTYQHIDDILPALYEAGKVPFILVLDGITDVRNFGAIARTCECAGVDAIVIPSQGSVRVNADAVKTSAGALHNIPVCRETSLRESVIFLKNSGVKIVAASEKASKDYTEPDMAVPVAIVMGAEDKGIESGIINLCDELVSVPVKGKISSLNVSVAAGIMAYEVVRQR